MPLHTCSSRTVASSDGAPTFTDASPMRAGSEAAAVITRSSRTGRARDGSAAGDQREPGLVAAVRRSHLHPGREACREVQRRGVVAGNLDPERVAAALAGEDAKPLRELP